MSDRGARRGAGAPFYAPPRRKTSAEIISEARAALNGEMNSASSSSVGGGGALRPLRTRRPFTPREPQRTLFNDRARKKEPRPPSAFDLKYLSLSDTNVDVTSAILGAHISALEEDSLNGVLLTEPQNNVKKKPVLRAARPAQERTVEGWSAFPKLPHLSGRSKPLHRRSTTGQSPEALSPDASSKRRQFAVSKSLTYSVSTQEELGDIPVKHLEVLLPNTSGNYDSMSFLELAEALSQRSRDPERTIQLMDTLQRRLEQSAPTGSLRDLVLRALYTHIDSENEAVLVGIARTMLMMRVTGTHLAAACKLIFKIARKDTNDHFFRNTNLLELVVEGCGRADPVSESECCVYGAGALRFLALEPRLCALAHRAGALHLAALHLKILNNAKAENPRLVSEQSTHALYQLTGALRNLASAGEQERAAFVSSGALAELLAALRLHTDRDVLTNVARCLSVLSADESCCLWLCASSVSARALFHALAACAARAPLAVRLTYTLGNMAAADEQARLNISNEEGGVDVLLTILESYTKRNHDNRNPDPDSDPDLHLVGTDLGGSDGSNEDVLIKTVRVVANLCLAERAGRSLAAAHAERTIRALLACLELAEKPPDDTVIDLEDEKEERSSSLERCEELATAVLATLNNITFYQEPPEPLDDLLDSICRATCRWLSGSGLAACEAVRALGNLSRSPRTAQLIVLDGVLPSLVPFLQHRDTSVRCAAAGVLVNVCGAGADCSAATSLAARALCAAAQSQDACVAALLTRALWNAHAHVPLTSTLAHQASVALAEFIDDESVFAACEASRGGDRRASDPTVTKNRVKFDIGNNNYAENELDYHDSSKHPYHKAYSVDPELSHSDVEENCCSGEDLGFEEGDMGGEEECDCTPCRRLAEWEELVGVAIPLLEKLRPPRADASVGTD